MTKTFIKNFMKTFKFPEGQNFFKLPAGSYNDFCTKLEYFLDFDEIEIKSAIRCRYKFFKDGVMIASYDERKDYGLLVVKEMEKIMNTYRDRLFRVH